MSNAKSLNDLGLTNEALEGADFADIPENLGQSFPDPPQPGKYRFKLPSEWSWAPVTSEKYGQRLNAIFDNGNPLTIVQSPGKVADGEEFHYRLSNVPRERTKEKILVSDMAILLKAWGEATPKTNKGFGQALLKHAGQEFGATVEFSYRCSDQRVAYFDDGAGGTAPAQDERMGCGTRAYQRDVAKVKVNAEDPQSALVQPLRWVCSSCGASVRAFPNLTGFSK